MLNFGLTELRLVAPRDGWPNPEAGPAASGGDSVLQGAAVHATVADAIADCSTVYASTVRRRDLIMPAIGPEDMAAEINAAAGRSAILFGPERSGLASDDVALATRIVTVPINPNFGSLNLAQAVILLAYEWSKGRALAQPPVKPEEPAAPQGELEGPHRPDRRRTVRRRLFPPAGTRSGNPAQHSHVDDQDALVEPRSEGRARYHSRDRAPASTVEAASIRRI